MSARSGLRGELARAVAPLAACWLVLIASLAYLGYSAEKLDRFLPGERPIVEALCRVLLRSKPQFDGTLASASRQDILIVQTAIFFLVSSLAYALAVRLTLSSRLCGRQATAIILGGALLLRLAAVPSKPALETDYHRYLWDGAVCWSGLNPFQFAPAEVTNHAGGKNREMYGSQDLERLERLGRLAARPELADHFKRINHPNIPTIYPPAAQALFAAAWAMAPGSAAALKALVGLADLAVCALLAMLLAKLGRDPRWVVAYAWCPLILKEYAGTGHYDPLAVAGTLAALLLAMSGRRWQSGVALAAAALSKLYPALLLPLLARRIGRAGLAAFVVVALAGYAPFLGIGLRAFDGLVAFGSTWEFNSSSFTCLEQWLGPLFDRENPLLFSFIVSRKTSQDYLFFTEQPMDAFLAAKLVAAGMLLLVLFWAVRSDSGSNEGLVGRAGAIVATLFALSPVADPWYFGWIAPFACVFPSAAAAWLAWGMGLYYFYFVGWSYTTWSRPLEYWPCYALLVWDVVRWRRVSCAPDAGRE